MNKRSSRTRWRGVKQKAHSRVSNRLKSPRSKRRKCSNDKNLRWGAHSLAREAVGDFPPRFFRPCCCGNNICPSVERARVRVHHIGEGIPLGEGMLYSNRTS